MANNIPIWWDKTLTVYNRYIHPETRVVTWYRTVLTNCFWKYTENKLTIGDTTLKSDSTNCRVPKNPAFRPKYEWDNLLATERPNYFTFGVGDIIVLGEASDTISEYTAGQRASDLIKKYKEQYGCMTVEKYLNNTGAGRTVEHYHIKGA